MATIRKIKRAKGEAYQLDYTDPISNKRLRKTIYCDRRSATNILKEIEVRLYKHQLGFESNYFENVLWNKVTDRYLARSDKIKSSETTQREYLVIKRFSVFIGKPNIQEINTDLIEQYINERLKYDKVSPATVGLEIRVLRAIFNQSIKWKILKSNPLDGIKIKNAPTIRVRFLRVDEVKQLLNVMPEGAYKNLIKAYLNTGARRNELLPPSFTWESIDFKLRKIFVTGKAQMTRYIPINEGLLTVLRQVKLDSPKVPFDFKPDFVSHKIQEYYKMANIRNANLHSLRKTFGSLLIQNGSTDLYTISKLLGHKSYKTTEEYYVDLLDENYHSSVAQLDKILG